ncbi:MAG: MBL fold metallo-hydrolase [Methanosarcina sp.]|jgi:phosphoribosyl 1,2-cyclic phosphate phosphodiesterase|uniref:MBL fold metallo-hydrolase n=1 Tax=Methanosarcina sp. TaxID=2213 RepID=UPI002C4D6B77|nr:MBL fold metallo-hydrolase [Methanosarcina sp.]MDM7917851.1 MBL fold metallo-hydrolase [Methanosarcina sp.]HOW13741.1 MBL fold metallo-hydrolase [Methanosarcina sp.]
MRLTLLGTGDAVGTPKIGCNCPACADAREGGKSQRFRFSILVESEQGKILIDTSPDLRQQFLRQKLSGIDAVIWTHGHYDHYAGFGEFYRVQNKVDVYGIRETLDYIDQYVSFLKPRYHYVKFYELFELIGLQFTLFKVHHPPVETPAGVIIRQEDTKIVITGDTSPEIPEKSLELIKDPDLLIADAIVPPHIHIKKHMNSEEAMALAQKLNAKKVALTHLSHLFRPHHIESMFLPLGYDGQVFEF